MPASTTLFARLRRAARPLVWLCILLMLAEVAFATACAEAEESGDAVVVVSAGALTGDAPSCWDPGDCHCPCAHITALVPAVQHSSSICSVRAVGAVGHDPLLPSRRPDTLLRPPKV